MSGGFTLSSDTPRAFLGGETKSEGLDLFFISWYVGQVEGEGFLSEGLS